MNEQIQNPLHISSVYLDDVENELVILDQTLLPNEKKFLRLKALEEIVEAIVFLRVRGAPAIGIAAAFGVYVSTFYDKSLPFNNLKEKFFYCKEKIAASRPTAVNLFWALERMKEKFLSHESLCENEIKKALKEEANLIKKEDEIVCRSIGEYGLSLLKPGGFVMTHCNPGSIATAKYGTALAPLYLAKEKGIDVGVFACETRPLLQGARLTSWELSEAGIDVTLICDNMASIVMKEGKIQAVLVGCDRIAKNGDTANKIGTSGLAILAKHYNIPFYVFSPISTIDFSIESGEEIQIEIRNPKEITSQWYEKPMAPIEVKVYNPAFDVTDNSLITAIITENGIAYPPFKENLEKIIQVNGKVEV
ncbi:UNVERIFIED_CONTAM: methylthioribose-1-phosphate isomerase [Acetivibrio alkalicellulosi]